MGKKLVSLIILIFVLISRTTNGGQQKNEEKVETEKNKNFKNLLKPKHTLGLPNKKYYIDRAGNYVYFGKPIKQGELSIKYEIENNTFQNIKFSIRYFYTARIVNDDIFDNLLREISGTNYKGEIEHDYRFLLKGNKYKPVYSGYTYLPRKFLRLDIQTPEGTKYLISPLLNNEIIYNLTENQLKQRAKLIIDSYKRFRSGISDIILYEKIRYSALSWITLKRSSYDKIDRDKIIWHFYKNPILKEQHFTGTLTEIKTYLADKQIVFNNNTTINYYKQNEYIKYPESSEYYILKFRYKDKMRYIIVPVEKMYHNSLNSPIKELVTFFARKYFKNNPNIFLIATKEIRTGNWAFINIK